MKVVAEKINREARGALKAISVPQGTEPSLAREYQAIFRSNGKPMVIVDHDMTISLANAEFERLSGYTKKDIEGKKRWTEFVAREDQKRMKEYHLLRKSDPMLAPRCFEFRFVDRHGKIKNIVLTIGQIPGTTKSMVSLQDVTDRRQAEVTQRASEERYQTFFENSRDAVYITTRDGTYVDANRAALELFGYTREEMKKVKARQLYANPADARRLQDEIEEKEFVQDFEVRLRKKDKTEMDCQFTVTALRGDDGSILEYQGIARDVTERKRTEEALRRSEERYRTILETMQDGYWETDLAGTFASVNDAQCRLAGTPRERLIGRNNRDYTTKEEAKRLYEIFSGIYRTGKPASGFDFEFTKRDGTKAFNELTASLIRDAQGKPIGFRGISRDVTERKRAEEALRRSEEKYRTILETMQEGYFEVDLSGNFTFVNDASCRHLGYTKEEMIGTKSKLYQDETTAEKMFQLCLDIYRTGEAITEIEAVWIKKDGTKGTYEASMSLIRDSKGNPIGFRGVSRNITERKKTEEALRQSEEKYRTIIENIQDGYFETDLAGTFTFVNDAKYRNLGYPREELIGMNNRHYTDQTTAKKLYEVFHGVYKTGEPVKVFDIESIKKNGTKGFSEISVSLIRDAQGKPIGFRGISRDVTERKLAEEALRRSEERYRTIIQTIQEGYYELDLAGHFTFVNEVVCRHLGYSREELIGTKSRRYQDETNAQKTYQAFNDVYKTGDPVKTLATEYTSKDGTKRTYEISASLIRDAEGKPIGYRGISRDVTERKQMEETLRRSEERYRTILENMQDGYFEVDFTGNFTFVNEAECRNLGYSKKEELIGMNRRQYTSEKTAGELNQIFSEVYTTGKSAQSFDVEVIKKDGTKAINAIVVSLIRDAQGKPIGFRGVARDVTERKRAEEALRQSEEKYRTIIENIQDGYFETDLAGSYTFANDALCKRQGYSKEELIGMNNQQFQDETSAKKSYQAYHEIYRTGEPIKALDIEVIRKNGTKGISEVSVSLIRDTQGKPIGFRGISRDITERKKVEEQLKRYAAELERSNEEVKNFAYIVSHDLRVPLVNLKGYTSELRSALEVIGSNFDAALPHLIDEKRSAVAMALHEDVPEALEFITNAVSRMDSFINAILILSRLGRQDLKPEPIDMNALARTTLETMSHQIQERGIEVIVGSLPQVVADRTSMEQIMDNILSNAVKYPDSSRPCRIEVAAEVNNGETIFSIRDTGRGIAAEDMHKVFAPFRRAGKQDTQGEGMGLAYVQTLVHRHGGRMWCESELGKGTTFAFTISSTFKQGASDA
jgi:PAS domain S-box-containing protein